MFHYLCLEDVSIKCKCRYESQQQYQQPHQQPRGHHGTTTIIYSAYHSNGDYHDTPTTVQLEHQQREETEDPVGHQRHYMRRDCDTYCWYHQRNQPTNGTLLGCEICHCYYYDHHSRNWHLFFFDSAAHPCDFVRVWLPPLVLFTHTTVKTFLKVAKWATTMQDS